MISGSKTGQQVAKEYDWTERTFRRRTKNLDLGRKLLTPIELLKIYRTFGIPPTLPKEEQDFYKKQLVKN